jgi:hypothetical protein
MCVEEPLHITYAGRFLNENPMLGMVRISCIKGLGPY